MLIAVRRRCAEQGQEQHNSCCHRALSPSSHDVLQKRLVYHADARAAQCTWCSRSQRLPHGPACFRRHSSHTALLALDSVNIVCNYITA